MDIAKTIATFLATQGLGTVGTDVFYGESPDQPDELTLVQDLSGSRPTMIVSRSSPVIEPYRFQVFTRAFGKDAAVSKARAVHDTLATLGPGRVLSGHRFTSIQAVTMPAHFAVDDRGRFVQQQAWEAWATP